MFMIVIMGNRSFSKTKLLSIYLGNLFEHYDTALYTFLSPFFATLFFPEGEYLTALILTFGIVPLGMLARPLGSLFFGYIGDVKGRNRALFLSLWGMALTTAFIALIPTYAEIGRLACLLLFISRIMQNFFASGENMGGAVCILECLDNEKQKDLASSIYSTSSVAGILLASAAVALLYHFESLQEGWRWLYCGGLVTALCGIALRFSQKEIEEEELQLAASAPLWRERIYVLWRMRRAVFVISLAAGFSYATYSIAFSLMNGFVPLVSAVTSAQVAKVNTYLLLFDIVALPFFGVLASRFSRHKMMWLAATSACLSGIPLFHLLEESSLYTVVFVRIAFVLIGVWFSATFHSWAQNMVPRSYRYSVISFSYAIGSQLIGGMTATLSLWLYKQTSLVTSAAWYWVALAVLISLVLYNNEHVENESFAVE